MTPSSRDKHPLAPHGRALEYCTYCPKLCRHVCPVSNATGHETLIPQAKMQLLNMLRRDAIPWQADYVAPLYGCTGCRLCQQYCDHDNLVAPALLAGRAMGAKRRLHHPALTRLGERFRERQQRLRAKLAQIVPADRLAREARIGYMPGCDAIDCSPEDISDALTLFDAVGFAFVKVVDAPLVCGGYPLWAGGDVEAARLCGEELVRQLRGFGTVLVGCPACAHLLRDELPNRGVDHSIEIIHISEFLQVHAERLPIRRQRAAAYYHDPCYLGRYLEVYDPPRHLMARAVTSPREFFHARQWAECCGGGGLVPLTLPEATRLQARRRLQEPELYGVDLVVTACPSCKRTLRAADRPVEVLDLVNLLAWSLG